MDVYAYPFAVDLSCRLKAHLAQDRLQSAVLVLVFTALASCPPHHGLVSCQQVITSPNANKNSSSRGSSEQTGTQRTDPTSAEYMPPSTRATTGSLPSRSRSSLSWGSDGQAQGQQSADKLARTASNAANARTMQPTPQVCRTRGLARLCLHAMQLVRSQQYCG